MKPVLALFALALLAAASPPERVVAIKAGRLIDTRAGTVLRDQTIIVRGDTVVSVGSDPAIPAGATVIDLSGKTVLPGLIDAHTHLVGDPGGGDPLVVLRQTAAEQALGSLRNTRQVLMAGFTTVRDLGSYRALVDVALRDAVARGDVVGPRMLVAGAYVTITGGGGAMTGAAPDVKLPWDLTYGEADSPDAVRQRVRMLAGQRVDVIKMLATGAVLTHNSNPNARESTYEELRAGVEEAANFGLKVAAHAHNTTGVRNAVRAGVASIEHGTMLDDESAEMMKKAGTWLVPTLMVSDCVTAEAGFPAEFIERIKPVAARHEASIRNAVRHGVKIAFGTDVTVCPAGTNAREFKRLVRAGMTPMAAIQSATSGGAELLGIADHAGSIGAGKWADIIAVDGDPLADVGVLENVTFVMKAGKVYKPE